MADRDNNNKSNTLRYVNSPDEMESYLDSLSDDWKPLVRDLEDIAASSEGKLVSLVIRSSSLNPEPDLVAIATKDAAILITSVLQKLSQGYILVNPDGTEIDQDMSPSDPSSLH